MKKALLVAVAIAAACMGGSASARPARPPQPGPSANTQLFVTNQTGGCVRLYFEGKQYDLGAGGERNLSGARGGASYFASVFNKRTCGGAAARNDRFIYPKGQLSANFDVY